ncbi:MAG TPA: ATP-binding protein [Gaiellaceae bacterium]|nr:ATP-binding protein [Gaiellaceae bacterium]
MRKAVAHTNPFTFGALALDEAFTDRDAELRELSRDLRNGQDVLVYAPRRFGKSSLVLRAAQRAIRNGVLVGYCDVMRTPTKERLAAALAKTIYSDLETAAGQAIERATRLFRGLRITPTMEVDPIDGSLRFVFHAGRRRAAIDDTIEALLALPGQIAAERGRRAALVFDEFQEIVTIDRHYPKLMRSVFQEQPEVAHVYLGSKRHVLERIFGDENEPFWRSAKRLEIGPIPAGDFARFLRRRFEETEKGIDDEALGRLLAATGGHPYATQELAYFLWELVPTGHFARLRDVEAALEQVLRSEHNHFAKLWDGAPHAQRLVLLALAAEPTGSLYSADYAERHDLPPKPALQRAIGALVTKEVVARDPDRVYRIAEPFFADWLRVEQEAVGLRDELRGR